MKIVQKVAIIGILFLMNLLLVGAVSITDVTTPEEVAPGEIFSISLELENNLDYDVKNLEVALDLEEVPFAPYQSSSEKFVDELNEGKNEDFNFRVIVLPSATSGIYKIPVKMNYENENGTALSNEGIISVMINSKPELKVSLEDSNILIKGRENEISIRIINSGLADVKFVYLKTGNVGGISFLSEKEQYIGDVDSDDFDSVDYKAHINENAQSNIVLPVTIDYKDSANKEFSETSDISVRVYSLKEAQELGLVKKPNYIFYFIIPLVILIYVIYRIRKKKRAKKARA